MRGQIIGGLGHRLRQAAAGAHHQMGADMLQAGLVQRDNRQFAARGLNLRRKARQERSAHSRADIAQQRRDG